MKAPEKIYLSAIDLKTIGGCLAHSNDTEDVEYTRTDAFINKACIAFCKVCDTQEYDGTYECDWVAKFRRKLKKELKQD